MPGSFTTDLANTATTYTTTGTEWGVNPAAFASLALPGITVQAGMTTSVALHSLTSAFTAVDLSATGSSAKSMFVWCYVSCGAILSPITGGGLQVRLDSGTAWKEWEIIGDDTDTFGGFVMAVVSPRITSDTSSGTFTNSSVDGIQIDYDMDTAGSDVCPSAGWGTARAGSGHTFTGGTSGSPVTFDDVTAFDLASSYGVYYTRFGTIIINGKLRCGNGTTDGIFHQSGGSGYMPDQQVDVGFVEWMANGSTESIFQTGDYSGGQVSNGFNLGYAAGQRLTLTCVNAAGKHKHYGLTAALAASSLNSGSVLIGCTFPEINSLDANGATITDCFFGTGTASTPAIIVSSPTEMAAITGGEISGRGYGIEFTAAGTYTISGMQFTGNTYDIVNSSSGSVVINVTNGANPSTYTNTGGGSVTINNSVALTVSGVTEGTPVKIVADETVGTITKGDVILQDFADSSGTVSGTINYETAFTAGGGLSVIVRARNHGVPVAAISDDGGVFTDETAEASSNTTADMTILPSTPALNDAYYLGHSETFAGTKIVISTALAGSGYTLVAEYWNGSTWSSLTTGTESGSITSVGEWIVPFTIPGNWATTTINSQGPLYYMRFRLSVLGTITTAPVASRASLDASRYLAYNSARKITTSGLSDNVSWRPDTIAQFAA